MCVLLSDLDYYKDGGVHLEYDMWTKGRQLRTTVMVHCISSIMKNVLATCIFFLSEFS